jgi:hypothetical protein
LHTTFVVLLRTQQESKVNIQLTRMKFIHYWLTYRLTWAFFIINLYRYTVCIFQSIFNLCNRRLRVFFNKSHDFEVYRVYHNFQWPISAMNRRHKSNENASHEHVSYLISVVLFCISIISNCLPSQMFELARKERFESSYFEHLLRR